MVARGDLGAELPVEEVPLLQVILLLMMKGAGAELGKFIKATNLLQIVFSKL